MKCDKFIFKEKKSIIFIILLFLLITCTIGETQPVLALSGNIAAPNEVYAYRSSGTSAKVSWSKVKGISGYKIYRKKGEKYICVKKIKGGNILSWKEKKLKKNKKYLYKVRAFKKTGKKVKNGALSYDVSCFTYTQKSSYSNALKIKVKAVLGELQVNHSEELKWNVLLRGKSKKLADKALRWYSDNPGVAKVDKKGKVTGVSVGRCYIYCMAHNGRKTKCKITVVEERANKIPVITFHRIMTDENKKNNYPDNQWAASIKDFEKQMEYLYDNGYRTISADEFEKWHDGKLELPKKTVMITFDDGDYELYYLIMPVMKKYGFKGTAFIVGSSVKPVTPPRTDARHHIGKDLIDKLNEEYPDIQLESHSWNLHYRDGAGQPIIHSKTLDDVRADFVSGSHFGFQYIAYPYGDYTDDFITATGEAGMHMGFTFGSNKYATRKSPKLKIPRIKINGQISFDEYKSWFEKK